METIEKDRISNKLRQYCDRYESQNRAAASLKGVSSATISQILAGKTDLISEEMWRNIASQIGVKSDNWKVVETRDYRLMTRFLDDARKNNLVMAITGAAGSGKSFAARHFTETHKRVYLLSCNEFWNKKTFLQELLAQMGRESVAESVNDMVNEIVRMLKMQENPLIVLDEADKLSDPVFYFFITLYNHLEDECGIVLCATNFIEKRLRAGLKRNKKGYHEIWSRIGRRCIELKGVGAADIAAVCEANGITQAREVEKVIEDSESDLRRVRRKIHSLKKAQEAARNLEPVN
jgi:DNA transposition AAA+ family ATPase